MDLVLDGFGWVVMTAVQTRRTILSFLLAAQVLASPLSAQRMRDFQTPVSLSHDATLVIGFLGGYDQWDDSHRGVRQVAVDLRALKLPNVFTETIENHHQGLALKLVRRAGASRDGHLRVILYGQSWDGAAAIKTARELRKDGISVALTVQVDSVGISDALIPNNVKAAANLYQHDIIGIEGRTQIRAEDPTVTRILENTRLSYVFRPYTSLNERDASWARRIFGGSHAKMEADAAVWEHVELLILDAIGGTL